MSRPRFVPVTAERVRLHRTSPTRGYADVRLAAVHLCGFRVEERLDGSLNIRPPETTDEQGANLAGVLAPATVSGSD